MCAAKSTKRKASVEEVNELDIVIELNSLGLEWSDQTVSLRTFTKSLRTPQPILVCEGKHEEWGPNTEDDPDLYPLLFALCKRFKFKIAAQCVNISPGKRDSIGPEFEIGDDFDGWFEIVSEDATPMLQIESVPELAKYCDEPFVLMKSMHAHKCEGREWKKDILDVGYEIKVGDWDCMEVRACGCGKLLRCKSFSGEDVYLPISEPGRFSLISEDYLTGPQTVSSLCSLKFPINVKLMEGSPRPIDIEDFVPTLTLSKADFEEVLTVWPMQKDVPLVHIPTKCPMQLKTLDNLEDVRELPVYKEIIRRIQTFLPKSITRPRWFQHTQSSLVRSLLQKNFTTVSSHWPIPTDKTTTTTSATEIRPPSTSNPVNLSSTDIHHPRTSGLLKTTTSDTHLPGTSGHPSSSTKASGPLSPTRANIQRPSNSSSPSTATTYVQHSSRTSKQTTKATLDIPQPSTLGLQSSSTAKALRRSTSKSFSKRSRSSMTDTSEESDYKHHSPRKGQVRTVKMKPMETCAYQEASRYSSVHSDRFRPLNIDPKRAEDEQWTLSPDASQRGKLRPEHIGGTDDQQQTSGHQMRRLRSEPMGDIDDQQTSGNQMGRLRSKPMGDTDNQQTSGHQMRLRSKPMGDIDNQQTSGHQMRRLRSKPMGDIDNQQTSGHQMRRLRSEPMGDIDNQQTSGQADVQPSRVRSSSEIKPLDHKDNQQASDLADVLANEDSLSETDESSSIDPYDEIDEIYAENKRIFHERCNIPLEKESFL